jgi:hypothetical protein
MKSIKAFWRGMKWPPTINAEKVDDAGAEIADAGETRKSKKPDSP